MISAERLFSHQCVVIDQKYQSCLYQADQFNFSFLCDNNVKNIKYIYGFVWLILNFTYSFRTWTIVKYSSDKNSVEKCMLHTFYF